jgi:hypothetical protein
MSSSDHVVGANEQRRDLKIDVGELRGHRFACGVVGANEQRRDLKIDVGELRGPQVRLWPRSILL